MSTAWVAQPERGSAGAVKLVTWLALNLGRRATRWLLHPLSLYFFVFSPRARRASRTYLSRALGRPASMGDVLRHYHAFASTLHDRVYLLSGQCEELELTVEGAGLVDAILERGRGCLLLGSHLGSFEALRALGQIRRYPITIVMYQSPAQKVSRVLNELSPGLQARVIAPGRPETMLLIKECMERGEIVGILGDRPFGSEKSALCDFLGVPARFPLGPFRLALALDAPVVLFFGLYEGENRYRICLEELGKPPDASAERASAADAWLKGYVGRLEHYVCKAPYNWFNFYDFWNEGL
jgi:predicted LPLAT superfamily acyltransferase